ncbi:MAG TPA: BON domain-containing protein [Casimicrobiaceae bacterium]|nr:BON domain-containing protein [Casimicrobiaceae bacterium]
MKLRAFALLIALASACVGTGALLSACVPLVLGGAVAGGALVAADRRSAGAQLDDEAIELKIANNVRANHPSAHVNVTSYNGVVLLTGEVPDQAARDGVANIARSTDRVRSVQNDLVVGPPSSLGDRSNDTLITSKVKARFVEANEFPANNVKVVTERGVVYLMGIVSRQEADAAARLAANTSGVVRVVRLFEYV